ncbi:MAG: bifunctional demethylmenaquinone methyltransferase/2-methoxy-6-polyprenyl-1,4-benzoquinol methylase UbiE [Bdellovibrionota bacterium]|nr:bifunctional demethylmenaquinone methyltransferase/2-methoxy-6-polyprenyl-1,4-benzoquinol methylase UbiE [Bdellovibrionota bacterium]
MQSTDNFRNPEKIRSMFSKVAGKYDLANSVLSMGIHHIWRKQIVSWSEASSGMSVLDCATGTGDLAIEFKKAVGTGNVVGTDFCAEMLEPAPAKAAAKKMDISFQQADVTALPYENEQFDISSISFGIRNVGNPIQGLKELARVVKPGGKVMVLEFGQPKNKAFAGVYNFYSQNILPKIGGLITGEQGAYKYLQDSSAEFPCADDFLTWAESTGEFSRVEYRSLSGGIAYMYKLVKKQA